MRRTHARTDISSPSSVTTSSDPDDDSGFSEITGILSLTSGFSTPQGKETLARVSKATTEYHRMQQRLEEQKQTEQDLTHRLVLYQNEMKRQQQVIVDLTENKSLVEKEKAEILQFYQNKEAAYQKKAEETQEILQQQEHRMTEIQELTQKRMDKFRESIQTKILLTDGELLELEGREVNELPPLDLARLVASKAVYEKQRLLDETYQEIQDLQENGSLVTKRYQKVLQEKLAFEQDSNFQIASLRSSCERYEQQTEALGQQLVEVEQRYQEIKHKETKYADVIRERDEAQRRFQEKCNENDALLEKVKRLEDQLVQYEKEMVTNSADSNLARRELMRLQAGYDLQHTRITELDEERKQLKLDCAQYKEKAQEMFEQARAAREEDAQKYEQKLQKEVGTLVEQHQIEREHYRIHCDNIADRERAMLVQQKEQATTDLKTALIKVDQLKNSQASTQKEFEEYRSKMAIHSADLRADLKSVTAQLDMAKLGQDDKSERIHRLETENSILTDKLAVLREDWSKFQIECHEKFGQYESDKEHLKRRLEIYEELELHTDGVILSAGVSRMEMDDDLSHNDVLADATDTIVGLPSSKGRRIQQCIQLASKAAQLQKKLLVAENEMKRMANSEAKYKAELISIKNIVGVGNQPVDFYIELLVQRDQCISNIRDALNKLQDKYNSLFEENSSLRSTLEALLEEKKALEPLKHVIHSLKHASLLAANNNSCNGGVAEPIKAAAASILRTSQKKGCSQPVHTTTHNHTHKKKEQGATSSTHVHHQPQHRQPQGKSKNSVHSSCAASEMGMIEFQQPRTKPPHTTVAFTMHQPCEPPPPSSQLTAGCVTHP